eukprot:Gb_21231 [translate_table: standard]
MPEKIGADDLGHMFGYATDETSELMPLSLVLATKIGAKLTEVRKNATCAWLRPEGKTQVTVEYRNEGGGYGSSARDLYAQVVDAKPTVLVAKKLGGVGLEVLRTFANLDCCYNLTQEGGVPALMHQGNLEFRIVMRLINEEHLILTIEKSLVIGWVRSSKSATLQESAAQLPSLFVPLWTSRVSTIHAQVEFQCRSGCCSPLRASA